MDFLDFGWVIIVLSGVIWNIMRRMKQEGSQNDAPRKPWQDKLEELIRDMTEPQTPLSAPEPAQAAAPAPRMSSGARGPAAPSTRAEQPPAPSAGTASLTSRQNLRNALILREVLSEPRAKQPWRPGRRK